MRQRLSRKRKDESTTLPQWVAGLSLLLLVVMPSPPAFAGASELKSNNPIIDDYVAPDWAKKVVWYQIFPERFWNGDPSNDPKVENIKGSWPHDHTSPWEVHPWASDWYKLQPYERKNGKDIWFNIQRRRYGGDLQGIIDKIQYLSDLGIGALYLNPVFESPSLHKYDAATYHHIDPNFGPDPDGDRELINSETPADPSTWVWTSADKLMLELIKELHTRGIRIIFDGVFNHVGINSWAFRDVLENQQKSKYKDWFVIKSWADPRKETSFDYDGWFGVRELPELREDENGIVAGPREYIFDITRRWMDPDGDGDTSDGIDGWRLDVAFCVKHPFWKAWRKLVKNMNPNAYLTAEIVDDIYVLAPYLEGNEFDAVMNYNFAFACAEYFVQRKHRIDTGRFDTLLKELRDAFNPEMAFVMQNLLDSHDTNRIGSHIVNGEWADFRAWSSYFGKSKGDNPAYDTRKPTSEEIEIQKLIVIFQMTYIGAPMVYYWDEVGMWGANDPCCRKPMIWEDLRYADERLLPDASRLSHPDRVEVNQDLLDHYRKLIRIRNTYPEFQIGDFETLVADDERALYGFTRELEKKRSVVLINNGPMPVKYRLEDVHEEDLFDVLNGKEFRVTDGMVNIEIDSMWGVILVPQMGEND